MNHVAHFGTFRARIGVTWHSSPSPLARLSRRMPSIHLAGMCHVLSTDNSLAIHLVHHDCDGIVGMNTRRTHRHMTRPERPELLADVLFEPEVVADHEGHIPC